MSNTKRARFEASPGCPANGRIVLADGSYSDRFGTKSAGRELIHELLAQGLIGNDEAVSLSKELMVSQIPEDIPGKSSLIAAILGMIDSEVLIGTIELEGGASLSDLFDPTPDTIH